MRWKAAWTGWKAAWSRVETDLSLVKSGFLENARERKAVRQSVAQVEDKLDKKVDRAEVVEIVEDALRAAH